MNSRRWVALTISLLMACGQSADTGNAQPAPDQGDASAPSADGMAPATDGIASDTLEAEGDSLPGEVTTDPVDAGPAPTWSDLRDLIDTAEPTDLTVLIGTADGVAFTHSKGASSADQTYAIASASKMLSAIVLLALVEDGVLAIDDTPDVHLDWWPSAADDPMGTITLEQLLSFTSGFAGDSGLAPGEEVLACIEEANTTLDACAQDIAALGLSYTPGSTFHYGPLHLHVAGAMATAATGLRFNRLFRDTIASPLGLPITAAFAHPSLDNPRVSGGATLSANDYGAILTALAAGALLSPESVALLTGDHTPEPVVLESVPTVASDGRAWHYALGCWRECDGEVYTPSCDEPGVVSSAGAFGFYPWWDMATGVWGVLATQRPLLQGGPTVTVPLGQAIHAMAVQLVDGTSAP